MILSVWNEEKQEYEGIPAIRGTDGKDFTILGFYGTLSALQAAVPAPSAGDAYGVGAAAPYDIYIYDGVTDAWVNNGKLQGAKGDKGAPGENGADGVTPTIGANGNWFLGTTDTGKPSRGQTGSKGDPGADGAQGVGIKSIQVNSNDALAVELTNGTGYVSESLRGPRGQTGTTFEPHISASGVMSWTNDGGKENPDSVNLVSAVLAALPTWTGGSY